MRRPLIAVVVVPILALSIASCEKEEQGSPKKPKERSTQSLLESQQVPEWSQDDMEFYLHGSMSAEFLPLSVFEAFRVTYPELFPKGDFTEFGLLKDKSSHSAIGITGGEPPHLAGLRSIGINCAACHTAEIEPANGEPPVRVLGVTGAFDVEAFYNSNILATFKTADPANMRKFLVNAYGSQGDRGQLEALLEEQKDQIAKVIAEDSSGAKGAGPGGLHALKKADFRLDASMVKQKKDLTPLVRNFLKLFHNMRAALHVPDQPPEKLPPPSGPGRNTAFGLLSYSLFGVPRDYAPSKFGVVWNMKERHWNHWDGNSSLPIGRNVLAALGLGAPLIGNEGQVDMKLIERHTRLTEMIRAPRYPFKVDKDRATRGAEHYAKHCASCHEHPKADEDLRLVALDDVKTDPARARIFDTEQAELFNRFFAELKIPGYSAPKAPPIRSTGKYVAPPLDGVWARAPFLHNGSVPTMMDLLSPPSSRPKTFKRGSRRYDEARMGFVDGGNYLFDTTTSGNSNSGHEYGTDLNEEQKRRLIEFLKTK